MKLTCKEIKDNRVDGEQFSCMTPFLDICLGGLEHESRPVEKALTKEQQRLERLPKGWSKNRQWLVVNTGIGLPGLGVKQRLLAGSRSGQSGLIKNRHWAVPLQNGNLLRVLWHSIQPLLACWRRFHWVEIEPGACWKTDASQRLADQLQDQLTSKRAYVRAVVEAFNLVATRYRHGSENTRKIVEELCVKRLCYA